MDGYTTYLPSARSLAWAREEEEYRSRLAGLDDDDDDGAVVCPDGYTIFVEIWSVYG